jgi:hypothetical protein
MDLAETFCAPVGGFIDPNHSTLPGPPIGAFPTTSPSSTSAPSTSIAALVAPNGFHVFCAVLVGLVCFVGFFGIFAGSLSGCG